MDRDGFLNFLVGLGVGLGLGLLFAPKPGDETRDFIKSKAADGADYLKKTGVDLKSTADDLVEKSRTVINKQKENLADAVEAGKQAYREKMDGAGTESPA